MVTSVAPTPSVVSCTCNEVQYYESNACLSCGSSKVSYSVVSSKPAAESLNFEALKPYWHGFFKQKAFFSYHRCESCGTLYSPRYFSQKQLDELYRQMPDNTAGVPIEGLRKTQEGYFRLLQRFSPLRGDYLEVGPDIGLFTEHCVREGAFDHHWLFEPNLGVRDQLSKAMADKPFEIFPEFLNLDRLNKTSISTVVMVHVLDHVTDPKALLVKLKSKLQRSAILLFVTHDESSFLARVLKAKWPPYCLQHPLLFNPKTITTLFKSAGFKVLTVEKSANYYPVTYLLKHALWTLGLRNIPLPKLNSLSMPFKLGNIMTVVENIQP